MEVLEAIKTRRSVRKYKVTPADEKTIELVLEAARCAPSWANTQCWRLIVVRDNDVKSKLADNSIAVSDKPNRAADAIRSVPVLTVARAELGQSGCYSRKTREHVTNKGDWYMFDVALAMQNLTMAAYSLGLGTVHIGAFDAKKVGSILDVPEGFCVVEMTPLGYPEVEPEVKPRKRKELSEIASYDKFDLK
ncbi:nitroreductase family protein [Chloroflexota bacterium]